MCSVEGCKDTTRHVNGLCLKHYHRKRTHGTTDAQNTPKGSGLEFLLEHAEHAGDDCLIWPYYRGRNGYAKMTFEGTPMNAHRMMCRLTKGEPIGKRSTARHLCGNGHMGCVNPKHLAWGTVKENNHDRFDHGTSNRGERQGQHKLTESEVMEIYALRGRFTAVYVGSVYGVSDANIRAIWKGRNWAWLTNPVDGPVGAC